MQYNPYTPAASKKYEIEKKNRKNTKIFMMNSAKKTKVRQIGVLVFCCLPALAEFFWPDRPAGDLTGA